jgi:hypothetical protein
MQLNPFRDMKLENGWFPNRPKISVRYALRGVRKGWRPLVFKLIKDLIGMGWDRKILQVKEKYGGLRFYVDGVTDAMYELIEQAERLSYHTCEACGKSGKTRGTGWIVTLCDKCFEEEYGKDYDEHPV